MTRVHRYLLTIPALALAIAACGTETPDSQTPVRTEGDPAALTDRTFVSTKITENGKASEVMGDTEFTLRFGPGGRLTAQADCNNILTDVEAGNGRLEVGTVGTTEMGCDPKRHKQDEWLVDLLKSEPSWTLEKNDLRLTSGQTSVTLLDSEVAEPDKPLRGTKWTLDSTTTGTGDDASVAHSAAMEKAYLEFSEKRVEGNDGCNGMGGGIKVSGDTIEFDPITSTLMACRPDIMKVGRSMDKVLDGTVTFEIDSNTLRLEKGDRVLTFTAS